MPRGNLSWAREEPTPHDVLRDCLAAAWRGKPRDSLLVALTQNDLRRALRARGMTPNKCTKALDEYSAADIQEAVERRSSAFSACVASLMEDGDLPEMPHLVRGGSLLRQARSTASVLQTYRLPASVAEAWSISDSWLDRAVRLHRERLHTIERTTRGIGADLHSLFGIATFGRYPASLLRRQHAERDRRGRYVLTVMGRGDISIHPDADHSGAQHEIDAYLELGKDAAHHAHPLRFIEVSGKRELEKAFTRLTRAYGKQEAAGLFFACHGRRLQLQLGGGGEENDWLCDSDFNRILGYRFLRRLDSCVDECAPIVIDSCETGRPGGLARECSQFRSGPVWATPERCSIDRIETEWGETLERVRPHYKKHVKGVSMPAIAVQYFMGGRIQTCDD